MSAKIGVISLGCAKNRVDTEVMIGKLRNKGYTFVQDMSEADVVLINTCSFIEDAREEALQTILEAGQQKRYGSVKGIVVAGCFPQHYRGKLRQSAPEVDVFLGVAGYKQIENAIEAALSNERLDLYPELELTTEYGDRVLTTTPPTAYVKIAEGCDNRCSYCVIPSIRGPYQSRPIEDVIQEVWDLVLRGYSEIILVAQDTTRYGRDLYGEDSLPKLLEQLADIPGLKWLRVLYLYPESITDSLLDVMASHDTIVKYIDMPIQHFSDPILQRMNRRHSAAQTMETVNRIRSAHPDFILRSTVIVGFPGESPTDFQVLKDRLQETRFDRLGVFTYSREDGTPAAEMENQVDQATKETRHSSVMNMQAPISLDANRKRIGETYEVLIEGFDPKSGCHYGRSYAEAPEVDGLIFVRDGDDIRPGTYVKARIIQAFHYDCVAELVKEAEA